MQWLSIKAQSPIARSAADYQALKHMFTTYSPDIFAFQEVDSVDALYRIINKQHYVVYLSERAKNPRDHFKKNNQYTGFAAKHGIVVNDIADLSQLSSPATNRETTFRQKLRYGSIIQIIIDNQPITLLNLHLKSGCFTAKQLAKRNRRSCKTLARQLKLIKHWVNTQQQISQPFIIVGDINHRIIDNQHFIKKITDYPGSINQLSASINANCTVKLTTKTTRYRTYRQLIDHLFATRNIRALEQRQIEYDKQLNSQFRLSDHCPLLFTLTIDST